MSEPARKGPAIIIGLGAAGLAAAESLRRGGWTSGITVLSGEDEVPYDRPPLSKGYLKAELTVDRLALTSLEKLARLDLDLRMGVHAEVLDVDQRYVVDSNGDRHDFAHAVVATGVRARELPGSGLNGVHVLRSRKDADRLRLSLQAASHLVIIGGGFLGLEVAATARGLGIQVAVIEPLDLPLRDRIGSVAASALLDLHRANDVDLRTGLGVARIREEHGTGRVSAVELSDGTVLRTDAVLVAIGGRPDLDWLVSSGLDVSDGLLCDERLSAAPGIWGAGDAARWHHRSLGRLVRLEHRMNAAEHGRSVGLAITGSDAHLAPVPFFWTDQHDVRIQVAGVAAAGAEEIITEVGSGRFLVEFRRDGELEAVLNWNAAREMLPKRQELALAYAGTTRRSSV